MGGEDITGRRGHKRAETGDGELGREATRLTLCSWPRAWLTVKQKKKES